MQEENAGILPEQDTQTGRIKDPWLDIMKDHFSVFRRPRISTCIVYESLEGAVADMKKEDHTQKG